MAYSVGLERPFRQVNGAQIVHGMYKSSIRRELLLSQILLENIFESLSEIAHIIFPQSHSVNVYILSGRDEPGSTLPCFVHRHLRLTAGSKDVDQNPPPAVSSGIIWSLDTQATMTMQAMQCAEEAHGLYEHNEQARGPKLY